MAWRDEYLGNRIKALDVIISNQDRYSVPLDYAIKQRKEAFKELLKFQLANFDMGNDNYNARRSRNS